MEKSKMSRRSAPPTSHHRAPREENPNPCALPSVHRHAHPARPRDRPRSARAVAGAPRPSAVVFFTTRCVLSPKAFARNLLSFSRWRPSWLPSDFKIYSRSTCHLPPPCPTQPPLPWPNFHHSTPSPAGQGHGSSSRSWRAVLVGSQVLMVCVAFGAPASIPTPD